MYLLMGYVWHISSIYFYHESPCNICKKQSNSSSRAISDVTNVSSARIVANVYVHNTIGYNNGVILKEFATDIIVFYDLYQVGRYTSGTITSLVSQYKQLAILSLDILLRIEWRWQNQHLYTFYIIIQGILKVIGSSVINFIGKYNISS